MDRYKVLLDYEPSTGYLYDENGAMWMTAANNGWVEYAPTNINPVALEKAIDKYTAAEVMALREAGVL